MGKNASKICDEMIGGLHHCFEKLLDYRSGESAQYENKDAALSVFGKFFTQSTSFLASQWIVEVRKCQSNVGSQFVVEPIPSDNQICNLLVLVEPVSLYDVFGPGL